MSLALLAAGACDGSPGEMGELDGGSVIDAGGTADSGTEPTGFRSLYIGHSFFRPFAVSMEEHAERAGVAGHSQEVVFAGGANGAPMALWNDENKRAEIQAVLDGGDVELFVMTYHSDHPTIEGYEKWFDYALAQNPNTRFALALPWLPYPETIADAATYESTWHAAHSTSWHDFIDTLRELYPGTEVFCIPYGQSAVELRLLFEAGELSDVSAMTGPASDAIYTDPLGHAGEILVDLGELACNSIM